MSNVPQRPTQPFVPQSVGERIAHARRLLGVFEGRDLLVPDLAERVGVTATAFYAWEADTRPGRANLTKLAAVLRVTPQWIDYGGGEATSGEPIIVGGIAMDRANLKDVTEDVGGRDAKIAQGAKIVRTAKAKAAARKRRPRSA